jgi:hypothetical protein
MRTALQIGADPWYDVVFHALSYLPVPATDASALFDPAYIAWADRRIAGQAPQTGAIPRSLVEDAALMGSLYAASTRGFLLHTFPLLWDGLEDFLRDMPTAFAEVTWTNPVRRSVAAEMLAGMQPALPELFRTALWAELGNGYQNVWHESVVPRSRAYQHTFMEAIASLAQSLPGLRDVRWILSHPLRTHGRGLIGCQGEKIIAVGVAHPELAVAETHPVIQACHEYFVFEASVGRPARQTFSTKPGQEGHQAFTEVEKAALVSGARFFRHSPWEEAHLRWLAQTL